MAARHTRLFAAAVILFAVPALADEAKTPDNDVQAGDTQIEACMAEARDQAPDATDHDKRIVLTHQCICGRLPNLCSHGMVQAYRLRQRILENK